VSSLFRSGHRIRDEFGISLSPPHRERLKQVGLNDLERCRGFRAHRVGLEEFLEEWYDRSAESCNLFENISAVDRYSVTCTVCRHFEKECCSPDAKGPTILSLLKASYIHDRLHSQ
jgi:hypothetical protein